MSRSDDVATLGMSAADREAVEVFRRDVVDPSMTQLVVVDFWAEWCGPCKQLGPVIEKVCADYAAKGVKLVKIDVDKDKFIAAQFQIRSIPTVYAIFQGQPVADLTSARTESQLSRMLDQLLTQLPVQAGDADPQAADVERFVTMGEQLLEDGDAERALSIFEQVAEIAPDHVAATAGHARALLALGRTDEAEALIAALPEDKAKDPAFAQAKAAIALSKEAVPVDDLSALKAAVDADPADLDKRYELAGGLMAAGDRDGAADQLLASIAQDKDHNEAAARERLLTLFAAVGLEDPWVSAQRRRLSAILFG
jgi:putative thioredoxin